MLAENVPITDTIAAPDFHGLLAQLTDAPDEAAGMKVIADNDLTGVALLPDSEEARADGRFDLAQRMELNRAILDWASRNSRTKTENPATTIVAIADIIRDPRAQSRAQMDLATMAEYAELLQSGTELPAVKVCCDGERYYLWDGFHTIGAAEAAGRTRYRCEVREGTLDDAIFYGAGANKTHGIKRTDADKRRAVAIVLLDPTRCVMSDTSIAAHCGVSQPFVSRERHRLEEAGRIEAVTVRVGKGGRVIDTSNIGETLEKDENQGKLFVAPEVVETEPAAEREESAPTQNILSDPAAPEAESEPAPPSLAAFTPPAETPASGPAVAGNAFATATVRLTISLMPAGADGTRKLSLSGAVGENPPIFDLGGYNDRADAWPADVEAFLSRLAANGEK